MGEKEVIMMIVNVESDIVKSESVVGWLEEYVVCYFAVPKLEIDPSTE
jgi:hypothetical protein